MSEETRAQCAGMTKSGMQCKNLALVGEAFCRVHLPEPSGELKREREDRLRAELQVELDELVERLREIQPDYEPPPLSTSNLIDFFKKYL